MRVKGVVGFRCWRLDLENEQLLPTVNWLAPPWEREGATEAVCVPLPHGSWMPVGPASQANRISFRYVVNNATNFVPGNLLPGNWLPSLPPREPEPDHVVSGKDCQCGLYAYCEIPNFWLVPPEGPCVFGAVLTWGKTVSHGYEVGLEGFRARFAKPLVLLQSEDSEYRPVIARIATRANASVVFTREQLEQRTQDWTKIYDAVTWPPQKPDGLDSLKRFLRY